MMAEPISYRAFTMHELPAGRYAAQCYCLDPDHYRPRYVSVTSEELLKGWTCPH